MVERRVSKDTDGGERDGDGDRNEDAGKGRQGGEDECEEGEESEESEEGIGVCGGTDNRGCVDELEEEEGMNRDEAEKE